jgi:WD40 repeat protein
MLEQRIQPNPYCRLRFSPDGSQLAAQGMDNSLLLWDLVELQRELRELNLSW